MIPALRLVGVAALLALAACATGGPGGGKLDEQLQAVADAPAGKGQVPVIVTLVPGTSAASYTPPGMQVAFRFVSTNAVAGAVPATGLAALAAAPEVQRVELDGEMKTLDLQ
ncbi:MAG TPA: hypothetical protein PKA13_16555 [Geminicoccaceae bacterium]|nr:hypothetical protein [Geminicoccus sp.]HMU51388.1 hypothetical protein [Geminicoccaceae bacterium]